MFNHESVWLLVVILPRMSIRFFTYGFCCRVNTENHCNQQCKFSSKHQGLCIYMAHDLRISLNLTFLFVKMSFEYLWQNIYVLFVPKRKKEGRNDRRKEEGKWMYLFVLAAPCLLFDYFLGVPSSLSLTPRDSKPRPDLSHLKCQEFF